ncbi:hypothetical protein AHiyo1_42240 [Arthrobacter sp. Hiyo1]|nr:hypothetical protein AHiyo1_42240 [Arthrobacter sp. Hiyo1]
MASRPAPPGRPGCGASNDANPTAEGQVAGPLICPETSSLSRPHGGGTGATADHRMGLASHQAARQSSFRQAPRRTSQSTTSTRSPLLLVIAPLPTAEVITRLRRVLRSRVRQEFPWEPCPWHRWRSFSVSPMNPKWEPVTSPIVSDWRPHGQQLGPANGDLSGEARLTAGETTRN